MDCDSYDMMMGTGANERLRLVWRSGILSRQCHGCHGYRSYHGYRRCQNQGQYRCRGLSLMEMLIALAISAMLLAAVALALDASFKAYGSAAEQASAQAATRMVTHRLLTMIRTSTAHGPLVADGGVTPAAYVSGNEVISPYIEMVEPDGDIVRIAYDGVNEQLTMSVNGGTASPVLSGVTAATFQLERVKNELSQWELNRVTIDIQVEPNPDQTLAIESGNRTPIRVITSTTPRKLD